MKGYLEQKGTPTPDKPVEIKSKLIGKNLFETYEVNGKQYTDNIPKDTLICISKEEFIEYKQQKEEIERLNNIINKKEQFLGDNIKRLEREVVKRDNIINELEKGIKENIEELEEHQLSRDRIDEDKEILRFLQELKGDDKE